MGFAHLLLRTGGSPLPESRFRSAAQVSVGTSVIYSEVPLLCIYNEMQETV